MWHQSTTATETPPNDTIVFLFPEAVLNMMPVHCKLTGTCWMCGVNDTTTKTLPLVPPVDFFLGTNATNRSMARLSMLLDMQHFHHRNTTTNAAFLTQCLPTQKHCHQHCRSIFYEKSSSAATNFQMPATTIFWMTTTTMHLLDNDCLIGFYNLYLLHKATT